MPAVALAEVGKGTEIGFVVFICHSLSEGRRLTCTAYRYWAFISA